jgi:hypothetical protein
LRICNGAFWRPSVVRRIAASIAKLPELVPVLSGEASAPTIDTGALADRIRALRTIASRAAVN